MMLAGIGWRRGDPAGEGRSGRALNRCYFGLVERRAGHPPGNS